MIIRLSNDSNTFQRNLHEFMPQQMNVQNTITPRDRDFDFRETPKHWVHDNGYLTHMFNAPSFALPYIEGFVNFTVINVLSRVKDKNLEAACQAFLKQETLHAREHIKYNTMLNTHGYNCPRVINSLRAKLSHIKAKWSPLSLLAVAAGFECFTSLLSKSVLEDNVLGFASKMPADRFWKWHMMEELEHKSVLMDLYKQLGGGYIRRVSILSLVLFFYCYFSAKIYIRLLRTDNLPVFKGLLYVCRKDSFFRKSLIQSLGCFRIRFDPRQLKTSKLINFDTIS
jgi:predicted metal-dependent hydrolase